jgi:succinate dehydrogenase / fumarate reductase flavoprotein subunit
MAVGEAACVSVHGANRLGSNSLIDLVVFGRAAGLRCAEQLEAGRDPARPAQGGPPIAHLARFDRFRNAAGGRPTADLRPPCSARCRKTPPCSAPARVAQERRGQAHRRSLSPPAADIGVRIAA